MELFISIIFIAVTFLYLRFFFKRLRLLFSLKKAAKQVRAELILSTPAFWFPTNRCKQSELLILGSDFVYSVKVIGLFKRFCDLHFWNPQEYATRKFLLSFQIKQASPLGTKDVRRKRLHIDFSKGLPIGISSNRSSKIIPFYLLSPANSPIRITKNEGNVIVDLAPGDKIDNIIFTDREYLSQYIQLALHERSSSKRERP